MTTNIDDIYKRYPEVKVEQDANMLFWGDESTYDPEGQIKLLDVLIFLLGSEGWKSREPQCVFVDQVFIIWGVVKWLRHWLLMPAFGGSSPPAPARFFWDL